MLALVQRSRVVLASFLALLVWSPLGRADPPARDIDSACTASYVSAQRLRRKSQLQLARVQLVACQNPSCPSLLRRDCTTWLGEVDALLPSLRVTARDSSGHPTTNVRVIVDGEVIADTLPDGPLTIDPGTHTVRLEMEGAPSIEKRYVVHEAEKNIVVDAAFLPEAAPLAPPSSPSEQPSPPLPSSSPPPPGPSAPPAHASALPYVLGIGGGVLLATGVTFEAVGLSERANLDACRGHCTTSQVDRARATVAVGDVASILAVIGLGSATYLAFRPQKASAGAVRVEVEPFALGLSARGLF